MIVVHNPTDSEIKDYPIQDKDSKEVLLWSILPGETLEFPDHVGKYLLDVYGFLQKVMTEDQYKEEKEEEAKIKTGKVYSQVKIVKPATPDVVETKAPESGFTNEVLQPKNAKQEVIVEKDKFAFPCPDANCEKGFEKENHLKVHYGLKHLVIPEKVA